MQGLVDFARSPPLTAPLRFFLVAPWFIALAGLLVLVVGPGFFLSRWQAEVLAATHLLTLGFMLQVMLGALIQVLPVVAGANLHRPLRLARLLQPALLAGTLLLAFGFLTHRAWALHAGGAFLVAGGALFLGAALAAFRGIVASSPTIRGLQLALTGLAVTLGLGLMLVIWLVTGERSLIVWTDVHALWGLGVWSAGLLMAVAYVVVPMFQLTPGYRTALARSWPWFLLAGGMLALIGGIFDAGIALQTAAVLVSVVVASFCIWTSRLLRQRRRARADATSLAWQAGMGLGLAGSVLMAVLAVQPQASPAWPLFVGILLIVGALPTVMMGMLYKIVPFLAWMHFQQLRPGRMLLSGMGHFLPDAKARVQVWVHLAATVVLALACFLPMPFVWMGAGLLMLSGSLLARLIWQAFRIYQQTLAEETAPTEIGQGL